MFKKIELVPIDEDEKDVKAIQIILFLLAAAGYIKVFGLAGAALILAYLTIHEAGHIWALERIGIGAEGPFFLPFLGAFILQERECRSYRSELLTALMGPGVGLAFTLMALVGYGLSHKTMFLGIVVLAAFTDFLNLLPVLPLDGGIVFQSIAFSFSPKIKTVFLALGSMFSFLFLATIFSSPIPAFFLLLQEMAKELGIKPLIIAIPFSLFALFLLASLLIEWGSWQRKAFTKEAGKTKRKMSKSEAVIYAVLYGLFGGVLLLVIIASLVGIAVDPSGLDDLQSLRHWPPKWF